MDPRGAWRLKHAQSQRPWSGPVHAEPLLADLGSLIVELGAGGGKVSGALPARAIALDWVREGLRDAKRPRVLADARALPFAAGTLDALVAIHVLGHLTRDDRSAALHEWRRTLRPGGVLVLEVFARGDAREGAGREAEEATWEREGILTHYFTTEELAGLLSGWEGQSIEDERNFRWGTRRVLRGRFTRGS